MSNETTASHRSFIELGCESVNIRLTNNIAVKRTLPTVSGTRKGRKEKRERERVRERTPPIFSQRQRSFARCFAPDYTGIESCSESWSLSARFVSQRAVENNPRAVRRRKKKP